MTQVLALEEDNQQKTSQLAFMARTLVMATLPHRKPNDFYYERQNGHYTLSMTANPKYGLPYGAMARMLLVWMTTEAVRRKSPEINLGRTLTSFLKKLKLQHGGGKRGNATRVREQLVRLLTCKISCIYEDKKKGICEGEEVSIGRSFKLWWDPAHEKDKTFLSGSTIVLSTDFFNELIKSPIPINFDAMNILRQSSLQIDIYVWLTSRFFSLKKENLIPWKKLKNQFGSDYFEYVHDKTQSTRNFKKKFLQALKKVWMVYPTANVCPINKGLILYPSDTHVNKVKIKNKIPVGN